MVCLLNALRATLTRLLAPAFDGVDAVGVLVPFVATCFRFRVTELAALGLAEKVDVPGITLSFCAGVAWVSLAALPFVVELAARRVLTPAARSPLV